MDIPFSLRLLMAVPIILGVKLCFSLAHTEQGCTDAIMKNPSAADITMGADGLPHGGNVECRKVIVAAKIAQHLGE